MLDLAPDIDVPSLAVSALDLGWPGPLIGLALGVTAWREQRLFGAVVGAFLGLSVWAAIDVTLF